ncbi:MAG: hypothetical protein [Circular genetic element sp.]|nr:MAG: hypothetical protein [Circular genetic element sp.]
MPHSYAITVSPKNAISLEDQDKLINYFLKSGDPFILWSEEGNDLKLHLHGQVFYHNKYATPASLKKYLVRNIYGAWSDEEKRHGIRITRAWSDFYEDYSQVVKKDDQKVKILKDLRPEKVGEFTERHVKKRQDPGMAILTQLRTDFVKTQLPNPSIETVCQYLADYFQKRNFVGCPTRPERQRALASSLYFMLNENETHKMFLPLVKNEQKWFQEKFEQINI